MRNATSDNASSPGPAPPRSSSPVPNRALYVLAVLAVFVALRALAPVVLPVIFALFFCGLLWPVQRWAEPRVGRAAAMLLCLVVLLCGFGLFTWLLVEMVDEVKERSSHYVKQSKYVLGDLEGSLSTIGLKVPSRSELLSALQEFAQWMSKHTLSFVSSAVLTVAFFSLALLELTPLKERLHAQLPADKSARFSRISARIAVQIQRYLWVRTVIGFITGVATAAGAWAIGLDFWYMWGFLNFILNYVPTIGSILGVVPPVAFALFQFGDVGGAVRALAVVGGVQLLMGNWIDPLLQGRSFSIPAVLVLFSVVFWGWLWGVAGALLAVPLTMALVLLCREYDALRWVDVFLEKTHK